MRLAVTTPTLGRRPGRPRVLRPARPLDLDQARKLEERLAGSPATAEAVDLDLAKVTAVSPAAVAMLFHAYFTLRQQGTRLRITRCHEQTLPSLRTCGLLDLPEIDAIAAPRRKAAGRAA